MHAQVEKNHMQRVGMKHDDQMDGWTQGMMAGKAIKRGISCAEGGVGQRARTRACRVQRQARRWRWRCRLGGLLQAGPAGPAGPGSNGEA